MIRYSKRQSVLEKSALSTPCSLCPSSPSTVASEVLFLAEQYGSSDDVNVFH